MMRHGADRSTGKADLTRARGLLASVGDTSLYTVATRHLISHLIQLGEDGEALEIAEKTLALTRRIRNRHEEAEALRYLGLLALRRRDPVTAEQLYGHQRPDAATDR